MKRRAWAVMLLSFLPFAAQAHGSLLDLSVYDRTENRRLPVYWHHGRAYVAGKPGNEYQIRIANRLGEEVP